ncbi:hypothetical protein PRUPE_1G389300 [Prunus persica]|uniref:Serpin domain-containing protein n=1 Tax=Prunus persica TaxID=3760 RepID=A0A251RA41_PRUPE|nr:hypothetical protein PRUPE_1G389300 [Prunus persica]
MDDLIRESIRNQNDVALGLNNKQLLQTEGRESNVVYTPRCPSTVIAAGSKGPTVQPRTSWQLLSFLKSKSADHLNSFAAEFISVIFSDGFPSCGGLSFANGIWVNRPLLLKPSFKQVVDTAYKAGLSQVDFQTNHNQAHLCKSLYFKGVWNEKFDASTTKEHDFHLLDGSTVNAPFMTGKKKQFNLYVSSTFHKSFIEVNEEGTEAAAASAIVDKLQCMPTDFVADHPFLFLIREEFTGTVLFTGHVLNPLAG